jgi:hypothetical protein
MDDKNDYQDIARRAINEAPQKPGPKPTAVKDKGPAVAWSAFDDDSNKGAVAPAQPKAPPPQARAPQHPVPPPGRMARGPAQVRGLRGAGEVMGRLHNVAGEVERLRGQLRQDPDEQAMLAVGAPAEAPPVVGAPEPRPPQNALVPLNRLPYVIGAEHDHERNIHITWHNVRNLPGYALEMVRAVFRPIFRQIQGARLEDLKVATTLDRTTSEHDLNRLKNFLMTRGDVQDEHALTLDALGVDPDTYRIEEAYKVYYGGSTYWIMRENLQGQENWYIYVAEGGHDTRAALGNMHGGMRQLESIQPKGTEHAILEDLARGPKSVELMLTEASDKDGLSSSTDRLVKMGLVERQTLEGKLSKRTYLSLTRAGILALDRLDGGASFEVAP